MSIAFCFAIEWNNKENYYLLERLTKHSTMSNLQWYICVIYKEKHFISNEYFLWLVIEAKRNKRRHNESIESCLLSYYKSFFYSKPPSPMYL